MATYDAAVIGAGLNGLTCAAYLARAGQKVLVVERHDIVGGLTIFYGFPEFFGGQRCMHIELADATISACGPSRRSG